MCVFVFGTDVEIFFMVSTKMLSKVIRAEAETCFLDNANKLSDVTLAFDGFQFSAHKGSKIRNQ